MNTTKMIVALALCATGPVGTAAAQHDFDHTRTVDPSGRADFTSIQSAIDDLGTPSVQSTVFIYAGVYDENITLDVDDENINLVGIDRDAVVIAPTSGDGVTITSGSETTRFNAVRNLTIRTASGHGIRIVKGGTPAPSRIAMQNVTIEASGTGKDGVTGSDAEYVTIDGCRIESDASQGVVVGSQWTINGSTITADDNGLEAVGKSFVTIRNTLITSTDDRALSLRAHCTDVLVQACELRATPTASESTVRILKGDRILLQDCLIVSDTRALWFDRIGGGGSIPPADIAAVGCRIIADGSGDVRAVESDTESFPRVVDCDISAHSTNGSAVGVHCTAGDDDGLNIQIIGGTITSSSDDEEETDVFDMEKTTKGVIYMSGTRCSKWKGPILSAERRRAVIQRTVDVAAASTTSVLTATVLTTSEQSVTTGLTDPDVYRVVSATGGSSGMNQDVVVIGTDWAGNAVTDVITLNGTTTAEGVKPFQSVTKVILPARNQPLETVSVGVTERLGLSFPIGSADAMTQLAKKASAGSAYAFVSFSVSDVDSTYATVDVGTINADDSFEFTAVASQ